MKTKLSNINIFSNLDDDTLQRIYEISSSVKFEKNSIIFYEGDSSKYLYCLASGIVKLYKMTSNHKEIILKYFHANELIAEVANFENIPYPATSFAYTDVELFKIDFEKFKKIIYENPELSFQIQKSLIQKIKNLEQVISTHIILDAKDRVIKFIYDNTEAFFKMKNREVAQILNVTPETLSRILRKLKEDEFINIKSNTIDKEKFAEMIKI